MNNYWAIKYWEEHYGKKKKNHPIELDWMLTNECILSISYYRRLRGNSRGIVLDDALLDILRDSDISVYERRFLDGRKKRRRGFYSENSHESGRKRVSLRTHLL